MADWKI